MRYAAFPRTRFALSIGIVLAVFGLALLSAPALAKPKAAGGKRIAVLPPTDGTPKDGIITAKIANALKKQKVRAVTGGAVKRAVATGVPSSDGDWVALARKLRVDGIVEPIVSDEAGKRRVEVVVHNGLDGAVAGRESFSAKGPPSKLAAVAAGGVWRKLGSTIRATEPPQNEARRAIAQTSATPADTLAPAADEKSEPAAAPAKPTEVKETETGGETDEEQGDEFEQPKTKRGGHMLHVLEAEIGGRVLQRMFEFTPASAGPAYNAQWMLMPQGRVAWFPLRYAGIFLAGEYNPSLKPGNHSAYPTYARELVLGAQGRYPLSTGVLGVSAAYFQHMFILGDASDSTSPRRQDLAWPDTIYQGVRIAASGRFHLWSFLEIGAEAGYRLVTNLGEGNLRVRSPQYFPNAQVNYGLDGSLFLSFGILPWLEIRGGIDYRRYGYGALVPGASNANDTNATGAADQYLGYTLGVVGVYGE